MLLKRTSQARYKYMAIFGELVPSWLYSQLQVIDPISGVVEDWRGDALLSKSKAILYVDGWI